MSNQNLPTMADLRDYYETSGVFEDMSKHFLWKEMTPSIILSIALKYVQENSDRNHRESWNLLSPIFDWMESFYEEGEFALSKSSKRRLKREIQNGVNW